VRKVTISSSPTSPDPKVQAAFLEKQVRMLAQASQENDVVDIASAFTITGTYTTTRSLNASTAALADVINVFCTLLADLKAGGQNRTT
jgi:hypothetical protein